MMSSLGEWLNSGLDPAEMEDSAGESGIEVRSGDALWNRMC